MAGIADIAYVRFRIPDLQCQQRFLDDFGCSTRRQNGCLYARGTDPNPYFYVAEQGEAAFLGLGFEALSAADLERIAAIDGVPVAELDTPGGGSIARLTDPDGFAVDVVYGIDKPEPLAVPHRQPVNSGAERHRLGERVALNRTGADIKRLGHCVLAVADFRTSEAWYKERFGFITSDEVHMGEESRVLGAFLRCNRGEQFVDHHTLFLIGTGTPAFNHAAFEVADWDTLMIGHDTLIKGGYEHRWGVAKHILGSQVFDYWKDPHGFTLEHFTDGDLLNEAFGSHKANLEELAGTLWGPAGSP